MALRRALIDLGLGLWLTDPPSRAYAAGLKARGKKGGVIACAMAHRATRIAYAMVRDQAAYDPARWAGTPGRLSPGNGRLADGERSGQRGAPAAQRGRTTLTATSHGAP